MGVIIPVKDSLCVHNLHPILNVVIQTRKTRTIGEHFACEGHSDSVNYHCRGYTMDENSVSGVELDVIQYAAQIGRLDFISALLACVSFLMVFGGIYAFINIRAKAEKAAEGAASIKAEEVANRYMQDNLPKIIEAYEEFISNQVNSSVADQIALAQERSTRNDGN